jgi:hypothetical protein
MNILNKRGGLVFAATLSAILLLLLYAPSLHSPYLLDDLAWLSLRNTIANGHSLAWALFSPQAQGTIRPLGERLWFLLASSLFGLHSTVFHVLALLTQIANTFLVSALGRRLLGSSLAGIVAALLWAVNDALVVPLVWASAWNEVLFTFWFLLSFTAFLKWIDSRKNIWLALHLSSLVLGFATLEITVVFPLVALSWVVLISPNRWKTVLPSALLALVFAVAHFLAAQIPRNGPYRMSFGLEPLRNFIHYWIGVLGPEEYRRIHQTSAALTIPATIVMTGLILLWVAIEVVSGRRVSLFCLLWFVVPLIPILPLSQHVTPYYTFLPLIGLSWLAGDALVRARSWKARSLALACAIVYVFCQVPSTLFVVDWNRQRAADVGRREARLARAVAQIRHDQPRGPVVLARIDSDQFWWGLCYGELIRRGYTDLYILPGAAQEGVAIPPPEWCLNGNFLLSPHETAHVYDVTTLPPQKLGAQ